MNKKTSYSYTLNNITTNELTMITYQTLPSHYMQKKNHFYTMCWIYGNQTMCLNS